MTTATDNGKVEILALPVDTFDEARMLLRAPFTPQAVKWKVQASWKGGALIVGYIDARLVIERLNLIVGSRWDANYEQHGQGQMWCHLTVCAVTRRDVGEGVGKGLVSDSLKRAAVHFGVGVSLYAIPKTILNVGAQLKDTGKTDQKGKPLYEITPNGEELLRTKYAGWLTSAKGKGFGEPFDHGDSDDAQGDIEVETTPVAVEPTVHRLSQEKRDLVLGAIKDAKQNPALVLAAAGLERAEDMTAAHAREIKTILDGAS
jgi:hypothetical protein